MPQKKYSNINYTVGHSSVLSSMLVIVILNKVQSIKSQIKNSFLIKIVLSLPIMLYLLSIILGGKLMLSLIFIYVLCRIICNEIRSSKFTSSFINIIIRTLIIMTEKATAIKGVTILFILGVTSLES